MKNPAWKKMVPCRLPAVLIAVVYLTVLATVGCAAEGAHHADSSAQLKDFGYRLLNFAILAALLVWAAKKADIKGLLAARRVNVEKALREADEIKAEAERKLAEYSEKLEKATLEIDEIQSAIRQDGEAEKNRIIEEAKQTAERIREQAKNAARQEVETAKAQLRAETARLAVQLSEATLKQSVTRSDQDRFVDEYLSKVVEA
jgi:F-type H+-transporting ATPase subunit b